MTSGTLELASVGMPWTFMAAFSTVVSVAILAWLLTRLRLLEANRPNDSFEIARRRYAAGEIDSTEFDELSNRLFEPDNRRANVASTRSTWSSALFAGAALPLLAASLGLLAGGVLDQRDSSAASMGQMMRDMMGGGMMEGMMERSTVDAPAIAGGQSETISMQHLTFTPGNLHVPVGAMLTWDNLDDVPHTATAVDGKWDTGILNKEQKKSMRFDSAGDYSYYCKVHPNMRARIVVG